MMKDKLIDYIVIISGLLIIIAVAFVTFPAMLGLNKSMLYLLLAVLSLSFGYLYAHVAVDLLKLEKKPHVFILTLIPIAGFILIFYLASQANSLIAALDLKVTEVNPWLTGLLFAVLFMLPTAFHLRVLK